MRILRELTRRWRRRRQLRGEDEYDGGVRARRRKQKRAWVRRTSVVRVVLTFVVFLAILGLLLRSQQLHKQLKQQQHMEAVQHHIGSPKNESEKTKALTAPPQDTQRLFSRRCFRSRRARAALCVHRPLCAVEGGAVVVGDSRTCVGAQSAVQCASEERAAEEAAAVRASHAPHSWLARADSSQRVHWWAGGTVVLRCDKSAGASAVQFVRRVLMAYHVRAHALRYGLPLRPAVVVVADRAHVRRLRFRRSWHHALLAALAYPRKPTFDRSTALAAAGVPNDAVSVLVGWRALAPDAAPHTSVKKRPIACFRHAAFAAPGNRFSLERDAFPPAAHADIAADDMRGVRERGEAARKDADAVAFRNALFAAVLGKRAPPPRRRVVYLHRSRLRALSAPDGVRRLETLLRRVAASHGFEYGRVDMDGLPVSAVLAATGDAGVVVGVHGTTLLATLFLGAGSSIVEILPYRFSHTLYARAPGCAVMYASHQLLHGKDYALISQFQSAAACQSASRRCRSWYRSDSRALAFREDDAGRVSGLVSRAMAHVIAHTPGRS